MVKCGIGTGKDAGDNFETTVDYDDINNKCIGQCLIKELKALKEGGEENDKVIVFAMGSRVYNTLFSYLFKEDNEQIIGDLRIELHQLPHPADHTSNKYRKYILLGIIANALLSNENIGDDYKKTLEETIIKAYRQQDKFEIRADIQLEEANIILKFKKGYIKYKCKSDNNPHKICEFKYDDNKGSQYRFWMKPDCEGIKYCDYKGNREIERNNIPEEVYNIIKNNKDKIFKIICS